MMQKKHLLWCTLILLICSVLFIHITAFAQSWNNCPFNIENDPFPGECGRYIDTNQDGICDLSQDEPVNDNSDRNINAERNVLPSDAASHAATSSEEEYSVEISGSQLKTMTIKEIAALWAIDAEDLLQKLKMGLLLKGEYTVNNTINELRTEIRFSPVIIKKTAELLKKQQTEHFEQSNKISTLDEQSNKSIAHEKKSSIIIISQPLRY